MPRSLRNLSIALLVFGSVLWPILGKAQTAVNEKPRPAVIVDVQTRQEEGETLFQYTVRWLADPDKGQEVIIGDNEVITATEGKQYRAKQKVFVATIDHIDGTTRYLIVDQDRRGGILWLLGIFVLAVAWFSRWQGIRSLVGLALSLVVIVGWIVPRIATGAAPVPTTLLGSAVVLIVGFLLTEGWSRLTAAALIGTIVTMLVIGGASVAAISIAGLTGNASEETFFLQSITGLSIDLRGLLLAGIIIGTLGILDDIAISQGATVGELRRANPLYTRRQLYQAAMRVGRSHLVAIINTLTFAYAGSALPLLVLFHSGQQSWSSALNSEMIASEIVRSIVGSLGLILALPISTLMAVVLNVRSTHQESEHGHHH